MEPSDNYPDTGGRNELLPFSQEGHTLQSLTAVVVLSICMTGAAAAELSGSVPSHERTFAHDSGATIASLSLSRLSLRQKR